MATPAQQPGTDPDFLLHRNKTLDQTPGSDIRVIVQCSIASGDLQMANANTATTSKKGFFDVTKVMGDFRVPGIDIEAAISSQRKNIEALTQANQLAVEGVQALMRRQVEITRQAMEDFSAMFRDFVQPNGTPEDRIVKQAEYSKLAIEKSLSNAKEL